ncbi:hypothetical protein B0J13DRAFT_431524 [Dactylonectria estremocensis]|uniref:Uncharacterized protein n=1 Tax=Dactylonectria estremocensis TaxID=1079267 RepID=A0A9P9FJ01_9HYPO|nr:hypothetical protein B0J13DRAFT_431524 [Dactylonectria estremocensis]
MDPAAGRSAHIPPPGIKRPVDSYHRQLHETHGVQIVPPSVENTGSGSGSGSRADRSSGSWRGRIAATSVGRSGTFSHVTSFFDSERLARSAVQSEGSYSAEAPNRMRWPFLGSIRSQRSSPGSPVSAMPGLGSEAGDSNDITLPWRPFFLHRRVLALFALLFAALIAGLEAALVVSNRNDGLRTSDEASRLLWQYGVVLVFVVVTAIWTRVEYQTAAAAPWMRMSKAPADIDKSLLLDYASQFPPWAMVKALQNADWLVAMTFAIGLLLKAVVVFSTAMITPKLIPFSDRSAAITVEAGFSQSNIGLQDVGSLPYFAMVGLQKNNMSFPNGISFRATYLPFSSDSDNLTMLNATVDGYIGGMDCDTATLTLKNMRYQGGSIRINVTASSSTCTTSQLISSTRFSTTSDQDLSRKFLTFQAGSCDGSTETDDQRIVVMAGTVDLDFDAIKNAKQKSSSTVTTLSGQISSSTAFICTPNYVITDMRVSRDTENLLSIQQASGAENTTIEGIEPWDIAAAHFDSYTTTETINDTSFTAATGFYQNETVLSANKPMFAALAMRAKESGSLPELAALENDSTLKLLAEDYYAQYSALVARYSMMEPTSTSSTAVLRSIQRRLIVRPPPTHVMAGLLAICLLMTLTAIFLAPNRGFLPRDPTALVDMAAIVAHSHPLVECLRGMGAASEEAIRVRLGGSEYTTGAEGHEKLGDPNLGYFHIFGGKEPPRNAHTRRSATARWRQPVFFHGLIRLLYALVLASVIIGIEVALRVSERSNGLRTLENDNAYLAWTAAPALVLLSIALYMSEVDWWARVLAPFSHLARQGEFHDTVGLNLVDVSRPIALWRALRIKDFAAVSTISAVSLAALFTVASAALFEPISVDATSSVVLHTGDFFANRLTSSDDDPICTDCTNDTLTASMVLVGDAPYPDFTFADLNLPSVTLEGENTAGNDSKISVKLTAIRPNMACKLFLASEIITNITLEYTTDDNVVNPLQIDLNGEDCRGSRASDSNAIISTAGVSAQSDSSSSDTGAFFGVGLDKTNSSLQCSDWVYVWGRLVNMDSDGVSVNSINALACNETIEAVEVDVNLYGANLRIDPADPPALDETTVEDTSVAIPDLDYSSLINVTHTGLLDAFFAMLNASDYAVSEESLGGSSEAAARKVRSGILGQHGVIRAQSLNFKSRRHLSSLGTFPAVNGVNIVSGIDPSASASQAVPLVNGSRVWQRLRLRQGVVATRILQGLLGAVLVLHLLSWMLMPKNRLPRSPTTIASVAALLVDGNLIRILPRGAQWQPRREVEQCLHDSELAERYEMGWETSRIKKMRNGRRVTVEGGTFGIRALAAAEPGLGEELEMTPVERRPSERPEVRQQRSADSGLLQRIGMVRRGTGTLGTDSVQRRSVVLGNNINQRASTQTTDGNKEVVKVWWKA